MRTIPFGATPSGEPVRLWTWANAAGARIAVSEMGAALVALEAPDRDGHLADVTLGFESAEAYVANGLYAGAVVGRYANRIAGAAFTLDGRRYALSANAPPHCLHGGEPGLHRKLWRAEPRADGTGLSLSVTSPAGEAGFPGALQAKADYRWAEDHTLILELTAVVDAPCPVSLAPHPYWNLDGHGAGAVVDHWLAIDADAFTPTGPDQIPEGRIAAVSGGLDFRRGQRLADSITARGGEGLDHNFVLRGEGHRSAAQLWSPRSGRRLRVSTDRPGLQVYSLEACPPDLQGVKDGAAYGPRGGIALEPQAFPDSPNQPQFPPTLLQPGEVFRARSVFAFDVAFSAERQ